MIEDGTEGPLGTQDQQSGTESSALEAVGHVFSIEVIDGDDAIHMRRRTGYGADA